MSTGPATPATTQATTSPAAHAMSRLSRSGVMERLPLDQICIRQETNARENYNPEAMEELQANIRAVGGILQPLTVTAVEPTPESDGKPYFLISGFRRAISLSILAQEDPQFGLDVPCMIVEPGSFSGMKLSQLIENLQRSDLNHVEIAKTIKLALDDKDANLRPVDVANILGKKESQVSQYLKLLEFPKPIQDQIVAGELSFSAARVLMYRVPQDDWLKQAQVAQSMTYGEFESHVKSKYGSGDSTEGETSADGDKQTSSQRASQMRRADEVRNRYLKWAKDLETKAADPIAKAVWHARADTMEWMLRNDETALAKDFAPLEEQAEKEKEKAEATESQAASYKKFLLEKVREGRSILNKLPEPGERRPTLPEVFIMLWQGIEQSLANPEEKAKLGFTLETSDKDKFMQELGAEWNAEQKRIEERAAASKKKREEKKRQEEEAKKAAEAQAASGSGSSGETA